MSRLHVPGDAVTVTVGDVPSHRLLLDLLDEARRAVDDAGLSDVAFRARTRAALAHLDDRVLRAATGPTSASSSAGRRVALTYEPGGGVVSLGVEDVDPRGDAVPGAGGPVLDLDWAATNDLARAAVTARDGAWGVPVVHP